MREREFLEGWGWLATALGFEISTAQRTLYGGVLADLPDGSFVAGVRRLVVSPEFSEFVQYRRLPTLHELREQAGRDRR